MATSAALSTSNEYVKYTITVTQNSQSIENNTSNVTVSVRFYRTNTGYTTYGTGTVYCKINGTTYSASVTPDDKITDSGIVLFTKTLDIAHNSDGSKTLQCSAWINHNAPLTSNEQSYSQVLTTIPRKSTLSANNGILGTEQTLTVNRKSSAFTHTITYKCGSATGTICDKSSATSIKYTPLLSLAAQNITGTSVQIVFTITTYNGSTSIGSSGKTITCDIPESVKPSASIDISDDTGYSDTYGGYIQNRSKLKIVVTDSGSQGSTIKSRKTTISGRTYTSDNIVTGVISKSGPLEITTIVTDSRGRTATTSQTVTIIPYTAPKLMNCSVIRCDSSGNDNSSGEYLKIVFSSEVTSLDSKNTANYFVDIKKTTEDTYTTTTLMSLLNNYSLTNESYIFAADTVSSYDIVLRVQDDFGTTKAVLSGPSIKKLISLNDEHKRIAFGKIAEKDNTFECAFKFECNESKIGVLNVENLFDESNEKIRNGLAAYTGSGDTAIDPDTTTEQLILTDKNPPTSGFFYISTFFYQSKTNDSNKVQIAIPYNTRKGPYLRYKYNKTWSAWLTLPMIVEEGTAGVWQYRKWASGKVELWAAINISSTACTTALGSMYRTAALTLNSFPFKVTNPKVFASYESEGYGALLWATTKATTTAPPKYYLVRPTSGTISSGAINLYVVGTFS